MNTEQKVLVRYGKFPVDKYLSASCAILIGVVAPIAAAALALQVIKIIWGGQRAAEEAKSAAIKIVIAIAVVLMAPAIVSAVRGWFTQASWNFGG